MMRSQSIICDYCTTEREWREEETSPLEEGWLIVHRFDTIREEDEEKDFCSTECLVNYFN